MRREGAAFAKARDEALKLKPPINKTGKNTPVSDHPSFPSGGSNLIAMTAEEHRERTSWRMALQTTFSDPGDVHTVTDPDAFDDLDCSIYALDPDDDDTLYMIEQEYCFLTPDHQHTYINGRLYCCACGTPHPSFRANACGQI